MFTRTLIFVLAVLLLAPAMLAAQAEQPAGKPDTSAAPALPATSEALKFEVEAVLCTNVVDREPVGEAADFPADVDKVYLWTKVTGLPEGESSFIHHVWLTGGEEMADVQLVVKGDPWRTYSYKTIPPEWAGDWEVKVVGPDGNVIKSIPFTVGKQAKPAQPEGQ
jgi:hypothetical protein